MAIAPSQPINQQIFRAYDIRGIVDETLGVNEVYLIGKAFASFARLREIDTIVIARDGRLSGPVLLQALADGIMAAGINVIDLGMVPTPLLYYVAYTRPQHAGMMLTGSHNPPEYNGLKMVIDGVTLSEAEIQALYHYIINQQFAEGKGSYQTLEIASDYLKTFTQAITLKKPLHVVIDAANGVTGMIAPALFRALGCRVEELCCEVDGTFPHHHPDPADANNLQTLRKIVLEKKADIGLAFDGDGDRLGIITNEGDIIWPDRALMLFAQSVLEKNPQAKIVYDVKCTNHLASYIMTLKGDPIMWKTGHSFIKAKMAETNALLGGEMSGHFFFKDRWYGFDDALYAGARMLEILSHSELSSAALFKNLPNSVNTQELKILVAEEKKFSLMQELIAAAHFPHAININTIDGLRVNFRDGWGLLRPSNTSPYLVLRFEAVNENILASMQQYFRDWMIGVNAELSLPF